MSELPEAIGFGHQSKHQMEAVLDDLREIISLIEADSGSALESAAAQGG